MTWANRSGTTLLVVFKFDVPAREVQRLNLRDFRGEFPVVSVSIPDVELLSHVHVDLLPVERAARQIAYALMMGMDYGSVSTLSNRRHGGRNRLERKLRGRLDLPVLGMTLNTARSIVSQEITHPPPPRMMTMQEALDGKRKKRPLEDLPKYPSAHIPTWDDVIAYQSGIDVPWMGGPR